MNEHHRWVNYRLGRLGKNTLLGTAGLGARSAIQAAYLLIVSRWLGAEGYGLFAGSVALVTLATPIANWGSALLLTQHIAQDRSSSRAMWATALVQTSVIGSLLVIGALVASALFLTEQLPLGPLLLLAISELILLPASHAASSQCYALERGSASALSMCLVPLGRALAMLGVITCSPTASPTYAALAHFSGSLLGLAAAVLLITRIDGLPAWGERLSLREATQQGTAYAVSNIAGTSYQEVDKILMLQLLGAAVVGPYTVAFRVASIFVLPVSALISATLPRLMAEHKGSNKQHTYRFVLFAALGYSLLAGLAILLAAPFVPYLFGTDYNKAMYYLLPLVTWPVLFALRQCLATKLTINHQQHVRSIIEVAGLGLVTALNLALLPSLGAEAAVWVLLTAESTMSLIFLAVMSRTNQLPPTGK